MVQIINTPIHYSTCSTVYMLLGLIDRVSCFVKVAIFMMCI